MGIVQVKPFKPWLSFADQLQRLQERGLQVDNPAAALDYPDYGTSTCWSFRRFRMAGQLVSTTPDRSSIFA